MNLHLNRQQLREFERNRDKARKAKETLARVMGFKVAVSTTQPSITTDILCECGTIFRFEGVPMVDYDGDLRRTSTGLLASGGASTGPWVYGGCPNPACQRSHRVRTTVTVIVEEEALPNIDPPTESE